MPIREADVKSRHGVRSGQIRRDHLCGMSADVYPLDAVRSSATLVVVDFATTQRAGTIVINLHRLLAVWFCALTGRD